MTFYEWSDNLLVGEPTIDRQHKVLVENIKLLAQALEQKNSSSASIVALLVRLLSCAKMHFSYEETLFQTSGYSQLDEHRASHQHLLNQIEMFSARFESGELGTVSMELLDFLMSWSNHILESDAAYIAFNQKKKAM